jgi:hypothetical protein
MKNVEVGDEGEVVRGEGRAGQPSRPDFRLGGRLQNRVDAESVLRNEDVVEDLFGLHIAPILPAVGQCNFTFLSLTLRQLLQNRLYKAC